MSVPQVGESGSTKKAISGETVTFAAGAAGTTGVTSTAYSPIFDSKGTNLGNPTDTSIAWTTGTVITSEQPYDDDATDTEQLGTFSNGDYAIQYNTGRIRYKKATTGTSDTVAYTIREAQTTASLSGGDVEIGAVEIKNAATDDRADVSDANTARTTGTHVLAVQGIDAAGAVLSTSALATETTLADIKTAVQVMDDWDSSDNCKVDINAQTLTALKVSATSAANAQTNPILVQDCGAPVAGSGKANTQYQTYEDTSFVTGDSPVSLDINTDLGRNANYGYFINDGPGNIKLNISTDGSTFGDDITVYEGENFPLDKLNIDTLKVTWIADSAYRIFVR